MDILTIASQKGGAGKTTLSAHLAVEAERAGRGPVAVVDTDPQGSLLDGRRPHGGGHQRRVAVGGRDYATMDIRINVNT
jgi:cellulose biosynthesis protein BcsQ